MSAIPFVDLAAQRRRLGDRIDQAIARVLDHGAFILGPEVAELEARLATYAGAKHCITCANGTDALQLILRAEGVGPGDAVFVPAFTFVATGEVVPFTGSTLIFVDVCEDTFTLDPISLERAIEDAGRLGLAPRLVIPVDLFGLPADYDAIAKIAASHGLTVVADAAQSFGATYRGRPVGSLAHYTSTSFFPAKPLGCYGDGGAIFTDDDGKADLIRSLRFHGKGADKYDNVRLGFNSRLDTMQAAILLEKLAIFPEEVEARNRIAARYGGMLSGTVATPSVPTDRTSVWAQYTLRVEDRECIAASCKTAGVPTAVYYPIPMHRQTGYKNHPIVSSGLEVSERLAASVISIPMHPYLDEATQDRIVAAVAGGLQQPLAQSV